jgi:DNA-binding NarL/FixJ family response regulator
MIDITPKVRAEALRAVFCLVEFRDREMLAVIRELLEMINAGIPYKSDPPPEKLPEQHVRVAPPKPEAEPQPSAQPKARRCSARVAEMLAKIGVDPGELSAPLSRTSARGARAMAARRSIIKMLRIEGLSRREIAEEMGLTESTVYGHMLALRDKQESA